MHYFALLISPERDSTPQEGAAEMTARRRKAAGPGNRQKRADIDKRIQWLRSPMPPY